MTLAKPAFPSPDHDHGRCAADALAHAEAVCAKRSQKFTPIRRHVLQALLSSHRPLGAYEVIELPTLRGKDGSFDGPIADSNFGGRRIKDYLRQEYRNQHGELVATFICSRMRFERGEPKGKGERNDAAQRNERTDGQRGERNEVEAPGGRRHEPQADPGRRECGQCADGEVGGLGARHHHDPEQEEGGAARKSGATTCSRRSGLTRPFNQCSPISRSVR